VTPSSHEGVQREGRAVRNHNSKPKIATGRSVLDVPVKSAAVNVVTTSATAARARSSDTKTVAAANGVQVPATGIDSTKLPDPACGGFDGAATGIGANVNKRLFRGKKHGTFVEFGAADGEFMSNSVKFERNSCWRGLCMEPSNTIFGDLVKFRPACHNVNGAVCDRDGKRTFWDVQTGPKHPETRKHGMGRWTGWGGFKDTLGGTRAEIDKNVRNGMWKVVEFDLMCYRLNTLLVTYNLTHVDYMSVDVQGGELAALKTIDFDKLEIDVIGAEQMAVNNHADSKIETVESFLISKGYTKAGRIEEDDFYVRNDKVTGNPVVAWI
jgi:hypothetical protein